jgi:hypothetical protein
LRAFFGFESFDSVGRRWENLTDVIKIIKKFFKMEKKTFKAEVIKAFAAVVRNIFPSVAVKRYTLKRINDRPNDDAKLFLPGPEWELAHIVGEEKPHYYGTKLTSRCWSKETRVELLRRGNVELIGDICSDEELEALLFDKDGKPHAEVLSVREAFAPATPNQKILRRFLAEYPIDRVLDAARNVSAAFDALEVTDILRGTATKDLSSPYWDVARALAEKRPGWAIKFLAYMRNNFTVEQIKEDKSKNFDSFFNKALAESNLSRYMTYFRNNFPEYVEVILDKANELSNFGAYFEREFKARLCDLEIPSVKEAKTFSQLWGVKEPLRLLRIGYNKMDDPFIHRVFCENLKALKEKFVVGGNSALWEDLLECMLKTAKTLDAFFDVYQIAPQTLQWIGVARLLRGTLLDDLNAYNVERVVANFFPFSDWEEDEAKLILRKMAENKVMPLAHLKELPLKIKEYALQQVELQSQKELINRDVRDIWKIALLPEAEIYLIGRVGQDFLLDYVSERGLSPEAFTFLVQKSKHCATAEALQKQAERWHISQDQWLMLTQSKYAYLAPLVKSYVK